jgi:hypothetical protein
MRLISDEGRSLVVEDEAGWLSSSGESNLKVSFGHLVNITVG